MKRELLILRHGKSDWSTPVGDFERPLKKRGRKNAGQLGVWMRNQGMVPDYVVTSSAVRARETTRLVCAAMDVPESCIREQDILYGAYFSQPLKVVQKIPDTVTRLLVVGHNPGMEDLVMHLASGNVQWPENGKLMPTAALARFKVTGPWADCEPATVVFKEIVRPGDL